MGKEEITQLTNKWMEFVSGDHHKDRDCHFYINTAFSYGNPPTYQIQHYGYIGDEFEETYSTYEAALRGLRGRILKMVEEERKWVDKVLEEGKPTWDSYQLAQAKKFNKLFPTKRRGQ